MLSTDDTKKIKKELFKQINSWQVADEQKESTKKKILAMSSEELEDFLERNKIIKNQEEEKCIFCLINQGKIKSYKIAENSDSIAVLEINPVSEGHTIIVPKKHEKFQDISSYSFDLAKKVATKIKQELNCKDVKISTDNVFGHEIINVIPVYGNETGEKKKASEPELSSLQQKLKIDEKPVESEKSAKPKKIEKFRRRIP